MDSKPTALIQPPEGYSDWLAQLKIKIHSAQQRATLAVNHELILLYWQIGHDILARQAEQGWGTKVIERLAHDLRNTFPDMKGFSSRNLKYMRSFADTWTDIEFVQQAVAQLPWGHNLVLLDKLGVQEARIWYAQKAIENNWSRNVLVMQIESNLIERQGKAVTNFDVRLPKPQSDLAIESLKDPYRFDFLGLSNEAQEREIEGALVKQVTEFLLELGAGFAFVGKQVHIEVGDEDFFIDLLFYHLRLRCYIVIELKTGDFKPEHLGQLSFYLTAVDKQIKNEHDTATIGLLLCKNKNKIVAEYALSDKTQPMGIAEFKLLESLPASLQTQLPSIEDIERELKETSPPTPFLKERGVVSSTKAGLWEKLKSTSQEMRKNPTIAENKLWQELRNNKLGVKFRRQHPLERFILDFFSVEAQLAIEVDGDIHNQQKEYDEFRNECLNSLGISVLRFTNDQVINNLEETINKIKETLSFRSATGALYKKGTFECFSPLSFRRGVGGEAKP